MTGLGRAEYLRHFNRLNLVSTPGTPALSVARWAAANLIRGGLLSERIVILVGARARDAFGFSKELLPMLWEPLHIGGGIVCSPGQVAWLPHPSGRNPWYWGDTGNRERAEEFLRELVGGTPR